MYIWRGYNYKDNLLKKCSILKLKKNNKTAMIHKSFLFKQVVIIITSQK